MNEVLASRPNIAMLLVAEERIRAQLATGALASTEPQAETTNGKDQDNGHAPKRADQSASEHNPPKANA